MSHYSRRSIILGTAGICVAGAGVTAAAGGLSESVEGQADVQAKQAFTVRRWHIAGGDASFTRVSDDNMSFQAAVELNNGDSAAFSATVDNTAEDGLYVQIAVDSPDAIDIKIRNLNGGDFTRFDAPDPRDIDDNTDDYEASGETVQTGEGTFVVPISNVGPPPGDNSHTEDIDIYAKLDDDAEPGSYDIEVGINPLSTDG